MSDTEVDLCELAANQDLLERLAVTLSDNNYDALTTRLVALQLIGGVGTETDLGAHDSGELHIAVIADSTLDSSTFVSRICDLVPTSDRTNGTSLSRAGAIGSITGQTISRGPVLDEEIDLVCIEGFGELAGSDQRAFEQVLDSGTFTFTGANVHETIDAPGSLLLISEPMYGVFDDYESLQKQIDLQPSIYHGVDVVVPTVSGSPSIETEKLPVDVARELLAESAQYSPVFTEDARSILDSKITEYMTELELKDGENSASVTRTKGTLQTLAEAHARLRLSEQVLSSDVERVWALLTECFRRAGLLKSDDEEFDQELMETGVSNSQREDIRNMKSLIAQIADEHHGEYSSQGTTVGYAPIDEVLERASEIGLDRSKAAHEIDKLKQKGEVFEPQTDHLATT